MASGFFLGGLGEGVASGVDTVSRYKYTQGLLQLEQQRLQQSQQNQQRSDYMKLRSDLVSHIGETITQLKNAHPDWTDLQVASNPAVVGLKNSLSTFTKNLQLPDDSESIIAGFSAGKSQIQTEAALARAKEGPQHQALVQSEIEKNRAQAGINPDLDTDTQLGGSQKTANQRVAQGFGATDAGPSPEDLVRQKYDPRTMFKAEQLIGGNTSVLSGLGYRGTAGQERKKIQDAAADLAIARNMKPEDVNAEVARFMGQKRAASTAGQRVGNVTVAMDAAQAASTRVLETSAKVNRTQYPALNSILLAAQKGVGDTNVIQFGIAVNTLVNNYARAIGGGNAQLTDSARREAWDNLSAAYSKGQIEAAVSQINKEIASELSGAKKAMKDVTGGGAQSDQSTSGSIGDVKFSIGR